jgi:hypothetical protein
MRHRRTKGPETDRPLLNHRVTSRLYPFSDATPSKYPPAEPEALRLLAPQRGLIAIVERQNHANPISLRYFTLQATRFPALRRQPV